MKIVRCIFATALVLLVLPAVSPLLASLIASANNCQLNEGGPQPCIVLGVDIGGPLVTMFVFGWMALVTFPIAAIVALAWIITEVVRAIYQRA